MKNEISERVNRRRKKALKRRIVNITALSFAVIIAAVLCFVFMSPTFDIQNVVCEGNANISDEVLVQTAAVQMGENLFLSSYGGVVERVESLDYVEKAEVKRRLPNTVCIVVTEKKPYAYFYVNSQLVLTDLDGNVLEVITNPEEADQVINSKITQSESDDEDTSADEELQDDATEDEEEEYNPIWGYDADGDPIYKVNGGHYEFDDDGNRFFVDDSVPTATPEGMPSPTTEVKTNKNGDLNYDELPLTYNGSIIYSAPIVYGADLSNYEKGKKVKSNDSIKYETIMSVLRAIYDCDMLTRTTKVDAENLSDIKIWVEDRLEIWFGSSENFDYKAHFVTSVINDNLSKFEHAIMDFRDSKLYVRSADTTSPRMKATATPRPTYEPSDDEDDENDEDDDYADDEDDYDEDIEE